MDWNVAVDSEFIVLRVEHLAAGEIPQSIVVIRGETQSSRGVDLYYHSEHETHVTLDTLGSSLLWDNGFTLLTIPGKRVWLQAES